LVGGDIPAILSICASSSAAICPQREARLFVSGVDRETPCLRCPVEQGEERFIVERRFCHRRQTADNRGSSSEAGAATIVPHELSPIVWITLCAIAAEKQEASPTTSFRQLAYNRSISQFSREGE
jgi:hypothetical protein